MSSNDASRAYDVDPIAIAGRLRDAFEEDRCWPTSGDSYCGACGRCLDMAQYEAEQQGHAGPYGRAEAIKPTPPSSDSGTTA